MTAPKDNTVAVFMITYQLSEAIPKYCRDTGPEISLKTTMLGTLYMEGSQAFSFTPDTLRTLNRLQQRGELTWLRTPQSHYHVWHICVCPECCPAHQGSPRNSYNPRSGGKVWDHSQASFNAHLRYVDPDDLGTFPTIEEAK